MKIAVVGLRHGHVLSLTKSALRHPQVELAAVVEDHPELLAEFGAIADVPVFADLRQMLDAVSPDAALVATTNDRKAHAIVELLQRGVHMLIDKPLLTTLEGLEAVEAAAGRSRAILYLALTIRFTPSFLGAQRFVAEGGIGKIVSCYVQGPHKLRPETRRPWMLNDEENGGALVDLGSHQVDLVRWFTGAEVQEVTAYQSNLKFPELARFTDSGVMLLKLTDGSTALLRTDWLTPAAAPYHSDYRLMLAGTKGLLEVRHGLEERVLCVTESAANLEIQPVTPARDLVEDFLAAATGLHSPVVTAQDAFETTRVTLIARRAALEGRTLPLR